jgi:hypothetical protein
VRLSRFQFGARKWRDKTSRSDVLCCKLAALSNPAERFSLYNSRLMKWRSWLTELNFCNVVAAMEPVAHRLASVVLAERAFGHSASDRKRSVSLASHALPSGRTSDHRAVARHDTSSRPAVDSIVCRAAPKTAESKVGVLLRDSLRD